MGAKINVGYNKKIGQPNYGSEGAFCELEFELDSSLLANSAEFQRRTRALYEECRQAVESQLGCQKPQTQAPTPQRNFQSPSPKQAKYAEQLASQVKGLGVQKLDNLCEKMYQKSFGSLSGLETSNLIDTLREVKAGKLELSAI